MDKEYQQWTELSEDQLWKSFVEDTTRAIDLRLAQTRRPGSQISEAHEILVAELDRLESPDYEFSVKTAREIVEAADKFNPEGTAAIHESIHTWLDSLGED